METEIIGLALVGGLLAMAVNYKKRPADAVAIGIAAFASVMVVAWFIG